MSTATRFRHYRALPFCVSDLSGSLSPGFSYAGNLTLAEVMAFVWNLETITITTAGNATYTTGSTQNCDSIISLNPITSSTVFSEGFSMGIFFGNTTGSPGPINFSAFPPVKQPVERVCFEPFVDPFFGFAFDALFLWDGNYPGSLPKPNFRFHFWVSTDPSNAGRYRLYYNYVIRFSGRGSGSFPLIFFNDQLYSYNLISSGTFVMGGITINWVACYDGAPGDTSTVGIGLSATSSFFTY